MPTTGDDVLFSTAYGETLEGGAGNDTYYLDDAEDVAVERPGEGYDQILASVSYVLSAGSEVEVLSSTDWNATAALNLTGNEFSNNIYGNAGLNSLTGGGGADLLVGFGGSDSYFVDSLDSVVEDASGGTRDVIFASSGYTLAEGVYVEVLSSAEWASTVALALTGNGYGQEIYGNAGANRLVGGGGADTLVGFGGSDEYHVDSADDLVVEDAGQGGRDVVYSSVNYVLAAGAQVEVLSTSAWSATTALDLTGNGYGQEIYGNAGANRLIGGGGADTLVGFGGSDEYHVDSADDLVVEDAGQGGRDVVYSSVNYVLAAGAQVEVLSTSAWSATTALDLTGNGYGQEIYGNAGANRLIGGGGADTLVGFGGSDEYHVDSDDVVVEQVGGGRDAVFATTDYSLRAGSEIEVLSTGNWSAVTTASLAGNEFSNELYGDAGNNSLNGGGGADYLAGFGGNDSYYVDSAADSVVEAVGAGRDTVFAATHYLLGSNVNVEVLSTDAWGGLAAINLTGNELDNEIYGNAGINVLDGGAGNDLLTGFGGSDTFAFSTQLGAGNVDIISGFEAGDRILLGGNAGQPFAALASGTLGADAFVIGAGAADAADRIIYNSATGALLYDADGIGGAAAVQFASLSPGLALTAGHFTISGAANSLPVLSSGATATVQENSATSTIVYHAIAQDADGDSIVYSLEGADASRLTIDQTGAVRLVNSADYESQSVYNFTVRVVDSSGAGSTRSVALNVTDVAENPGSAPYVVTETENNNTAGTAQPLNRDLFTVTNDSDLEDPSLPSAQINGSISAPGDEDFFTVTLQAGERLIIDVDGTTNGLDSFVRVFGPNGEEIGFNDDTGALDPGSSNHPTYGHNTDSLVSFRAPTSGTYTFSVASYVDSGTSQATSSGSYTVNVSIGPVATPEQINEENIQALIGSDGWPDLNLTYGFTTSASQYGANEGVEERATGFEVLNSTQQGAVRQILTYISGLTNLSFTELGFNPGSAQLRYAMSDDPATAHAYYPGTGNGGDSWYNNSSGTYDNPRVGNYAWMTFLHETGHALGLKHGHEAPALSPERNSIEYSIMTYAGYIGAPTDAENGGYRNETWGFAQTLMMYDIAALQRLYGADFGLNAGNSVYSWNPLSGAFLINGTTQWTPGGNRVFMTVWDGGGTDTYDLSNYGSGVTIDLRPGEWTTTSQVQIAYLGDGHYAVGNVANALLYNDDTRSLIENAIGGSGNDTLIANEAGNRLTGGAGADTFRFASSGDVGLNGLADIISDFQQGSDRIDLSGIDANSGAAGDQGFTFVGGNAFTGTAGQLRYEASGGSVQIFGDINGDGVADFSIRLENVGSVNSDAFIL